MAIADQPRTVAGQDPVFEELNLDLIRPGYRQRPTRPDKLKKMHREGYAQTRFGVVSVNMREDDMVYRYCFDGMHRVVFARECGLLTVPAYCYFGLTMEEEAHEFKEINSSQAPASALERFDARLGYHDPSAVRIKAIVEAHGMVIPRSNGGRNRSPNQLKAIARADQIYHIGGERGLDVTLSIIERAWEHRDANALVGTVLQSIFWVVYNHVFSGEISTDQLVAFMRRVTPMALERAGREVRSRMGMAPASASMDFGYRALIDLINASRRRRETWLEYRPTVIHRDDRSTTKLTTAMLDDIKIRMQAGEKYSRLATEYGITASTLQSALRVDRGEEKPSAESGE